MKNSKINKYIGKKYGFLEITDIYKKEATNIALCKCDCGCSKEINLWNIISGKTKSCGCYEKSSRFGRHHAKTDIIGNKYGRLTVLKDSGKRASNGAVLWECQCDCGNITYAESSNLKRGHKTSCGCVLNEYVDSLKQNIIGQKFGYLTVIKEADREKYKRRTYICKCDCGNELIIDGASLTTGHTISCGCIKSSKGELLVKEILDRNGIKYYQEYRFDDCRNERRLPFDFYLPENNICIEYQGKQHFEVVDYWGGEEGLKQCQKRDNIKKEYCKSNDITLLEIPYNKSRLEVESMILNVLNP